MGRFIEDREAWLAEGHDESARDHEARLCMLACSTLMGITGILDGEPAPGFLYIDGCSQMCALLMEVIPLHTGCHYEGDTVLIELFGWVATCWMNGLRNGRSARRLLAGRPTG